MTEWTKPGLIDVPTIDDDLGSLSVVEREAPFPFAIKRVYFIHHVTEGAVRGSHAHKDLRQLIVAVSGSFTVRLDDGREATDFHLNAPSVGLTVPPGYWRTLIDFTPGAVALVFASAEYDPADYIRDYDAFVEWATHD